MAASCSSSFSGNPRGEKFQVFISFRGPDVRESFLSYLFDALQRKQIKAFKDDINLERGEEITPSLMKIIEESNLSIVIFSKEYPNSAWCLDELVKILECKESRKQIVVPVFYHVNASDVQELKGDYAITRHVQQFQNCNQVKNWRRALVEISNLSGLHSGNPMYRPESKLCEEIVNVVEAKLKDLFPCDSHYYYGLFGIDSRIKDVESLLHIESEVNNVSMVGVWGMGGVGKTTIADKVFNRNKKNFDGHYFASNVREALSKKYGPVDLRDKIICELLRDKKIKAGSPFSINDSIRIRLQRMKVLIVLDDVESCWQLKSLLQDSGLCSPSMFCPGSRIIVTSRDRQVLENVDMKSYIYEVKQLNLDEAIQLFSWHAFGQKYPQRGFEYLSVKVVEYAHRLPLALVVLGSELKGKKTEEWQAALRKFSSVPHVDILKILRESFDGLDRDQKNLFLDIACFFKGFYREDAERILETFDFNSRNGIDRLCDKSLITIEKGIITMHDLLQQMGQEIVVEKSEQMCEKQSRLWTYEDISDVLMNGEGSENVEGILLNVMEIDDGTHIDISSKAFIGMHKLRFLQVIDINFWFPRNQEKVGKLRFSKGLEFLPNSLRYLCWDYYPLSYLPSNFSMDKLVELDMCNSQLKQLIWKKPLRHLKSIRLSRSHDLIKISDLAKAPNLEVIELRNCINLVEIGPSMKNLRKLTVLDLEGCTSLRQLPEIPCTIEKLNLDGSGLRQLPSAIGRLTLSSLRLESCKSLKSLPSSIGYLGRMQELKFYKCSNLASLPNTICKMRSLKRLSISDCKNLKKLPKHLGNLEHLETLDASYTGLKELPASIQHLKKLRELNCCGCDDLELPPLIGLPLLSSIDLSNCHMLEFPKLCSLTSLEYLDVGGNNFKSVTPDIKHLYKLRYLDLSKCEKLESLPDLPSNLETLFAASCMSLESLSATFKFPRIYLDLSNCHKLKEGRASSIIQKLVWEIHLLSEGPNLWIPGSEVPRWMKYRNDSGCSLPLELDTHGSSVHVFFCVVVALGPYLPSPLEIRPEAVLSDESGIRGVYDFSDSITYYDEMKIDLEHVFVWDCYVDHNVTKASFQIPYSKLDKAFNLKEIIIKSGVHPVLDEEDQGSNSHLNLRKRKYEELEEGYSSDLDQHSDLSFFTGHSSLLLTRQSGCKCKL